MADEVILPKVDMDMTEGKIAHWYVHNGERVTRGQVLFEIETDKATMEIEATADGVLQGSDGATGVVLPVGHVVGWIVQPGEAIPSAGAAAAALADAPLARAATGSAQQAPALAASTARDGAADRSAAPGAGVLRATPLARSIARAHGIDLLAVRGCGPQGRVLARDLAQPAQAAAAAAAAPAIDALHLHWFNRHSGVPLVLLHGFGTASGSWRLLAEQLAGLPVLGIDLPNHGKSPRVELADLDAVARSVLRRLDQEGMGAIHLAGHSMGGGVALALARLLQDRLRSLTLLAPLGLGPQINGAFIEGLLRASREASLRPWLRLLFGDPARLTSSFSATAWSELGAPDTRAALVEMAQRLLPDGTQADLLRDRLADLAMPVKLVWGTGDRIVPPEQATGIPGAVALHLLPGIGHLPQIEAVDLVARLLRQQRAAGDALAAGSMP